MEEMNISDSFSILTLALLEILKINFLILYICYDYEDFDISLTYLISISYLQYIFAQIISILKSKIIPNHQQQLEGIIIKKKVLLYKKELLELKKPKIIDFKFEDFYNCIKSIMQFIFSIIIIIYFDLYIGILLIFLFFISNLFIKVIINYLLVSTFMILFFIPINFLKDNNINILILLLLAININNCQINKIVDIYKLLTFNTTIPTYDNFIIKKHNGSLKDILDNIYIYKKNNWYKLKNIPQWYLLIDYISYDNLPFTIEEYFADSLHKTDILSFLSQYTYTWLNADILKEKIENLPLKTHQKIILSKIFIKKYPIILSPLCVNDPNVTCIIYKN